MATRSDSLIRLEANIDIDLAKITFHSPSPSVSLRLAGWSRPHARPQVQSTPRFESTTRRTFGLSASLSKATPSP